MLRRALLLAPLLLLAAGPGCSGGGAPPRREVTVFAATSLRDALQVAAQAFERDHAATVTFSFASSGTLARQILAADGPDAFVSADEAEMDRVAAAGRIDPATRRDLLGNRLVVVVPADRASALSVPLRASELAQVGRLSLGDPATVPVGRYARAWIEERGWWTALGPKVVPAADARAALAAVESGGCDAGIVYGTDAARTSRVRIVHVVPASEGPRIVYPAAVVQRGGATDLGRAFVEFLAGPEARAVFEAHGFTALAGEAR